MAYVDSEYYNSYSKVISDNIEYKLEKASEAIDSITFNRIVGTGFSNLTEFQQDKIKKAVCMQADFIEEYGQYFSPQNRADLKKYFMNYKNNLNDNKLNMFKPILTKYNIKYIENKDEVKIQ